MKSSAWKAACFLAAPCMLWVSIQRNVILEAISGNFSKLVKSKADAIASNKAAWNWLRPGGQYFSPNSSNSSINPKAWAKFPSAKLGREGNKPL